MGRIDNSKWIKSYERYKILLNSLSLFTKTVLHGDEDVVNAPGHHYYLSKTDKSFREILTKVLGSDHALHAHNRKFYYDPMYNILKPIYYDGNPIPQNKFSINVDKLSKSVIMKIIATNFVEDVLKSTN